MEALVVWNYSRCWRKYLFSVRQAFEKHGFTVGGRKGGFYLTSRAKGNCASKMHFMKGNQIPFPDWNKKSKWRTIVVTCKKKLYNAHFILFHWWKFFSRQELWRSSRIKQLVIPFLILEASLHNLKRYWWKRLWNEIAAHTWSKQSMWFAWQSV